MAKVKIDQERCKGCELCIIYCPKKTLLLSKKINKRGVKPAELKARSECTGCTFCALICPDCAIEVYR